MVGILAIISPLQRVLASGLAGQEAQVRSPLVPGDFRSEHMGVRGLRVRLGINGKPQASIHSGLKVWHFHVPLLHLGPQHEHCIHTLAEPVLNLYNFTSPAGKSFLIVFKLRCGYRKDCKGDSHLTNMERNLFSRFQMAAWKIWSRGWDGRLLKTLLASQALPLALVIAFRRPFWDFKVVAVE